MSASGRFRSRRVPYGALVGLAVACLAVVLLVLAGGPTTEQPDGQVRVTFLWESDCGQEGAPFELEIEDAQHEILGVWSLNRQSSHPLAIDGRRLCGYTLAFPDLPPSDEYTFLVYDLYGPEREQDYRESAAAQHRAAQLTRTRTELDAAGWSVVVFYDPTGTTQRFFFTEVAAR